MALGFNLLAEVHPLGGSTTFLDLEDFLVSNILLPLGSLIFVIFAVSKRGWGWKKFMEEANAGRGWKVKNWMRGYITYVLPIIIIALFVIGLVTYLCRSKSFIKKHHTGNGFPVWCFYFDMILLFLLQSVAILLGV